MVDEFPGRWVRHSVRQTQSQPGGQWHNQYGKITKKNALIRPCRGGLSDATPLAANAISVSRPRFCHNRNMEDGQALQNPGILSHSARIKRSAEMANIWPF